MNLKDFLKENRLLIILAIFAAIFVYIFFSNKDQEKIIFPKINQTSKKTIPDYQPTLDSLQAKSYYVYDILENKAIFSKDEHEKLPLASITKLMSGLVALDTMPDTTIITIKENDIALDTDNGLSDGLLVGEKWKLKDLLDLSLIISSNGGMHAIATALNSYETVNNQNIIDMMNEKAKFLGLNDTVFINETGLDVNKDMGGAYSSAYDVSMLLKNILIDNPNLISSTNKQSKNFISESNIKHTVSNTDTCMNQISGLIASKTGSTDLAGGNLAIIFDAGLMHPVAIVVLGSTVDGRFSDVVKLENLTLEKLSQ